LAIYVESVMITSINSLGSSLGNAILPLTATELILALFESHPSLAQRDLVDEFLHEYPQWEDPSSIPYDPAWTSHVCVAFFGQMWQDPVDDSESASPASVPYCGNVWQDPVDDSARASDARAQHWRLMLDILTVDMKVQATALPRYPVNTLVIRRTAAKSTRNAAYRALHLCLNLERARMRQL
jgi:hypothetical protein